MSFADLECDGANALPLSKLEYPLRRVLTSFTASLQAMAMHCAALERLQQGTTAVATQRRTLLAEERHMRGHLAELARLKRKTDPADHPAFDQQVKPVYDEYLRTTACIDRVYTSAKHTLPLTEGKAAGQEFKGHLCRHRKAQSEGETSTLVVDEADGPRQLQRRISTEQESLTEEIELEALERELYELSEIFTDLMHSSQSQGSVLDTLEAHMTQTNDHTLKGTRALFQAHQSKAAMAPAIGALVGGAVLGPVGLLIGAKGAFVVTALGGALVGSLAGRLVQNRVRDNVDLAVMSPLTDEPLLVGRRPAKSKDPKTV